MKKKIRTVALIAVLCVAAAGCQKETVKTFADETIVNENIRMVIYTIDGVTHHITIRGDDAWMDFIHIMAELSKEGHSVNFKSETTDATATPQNKEKITYTTDDQDDVEKWAAKMVEQGYFVTIDYDSKTGIWTGTAVK